MKPVINTVIFDLDGTVIDTRLDIAKAANKVLREFGCPELPEDVIGGFIGGGAELLVKRCLGEENMHLFPEVLKRFKAAYSENCLIYTDVYPGVKEVLEGLWADGIDMAVATNKAFPVTQKILRGLDIEKYFKVVVGPETVKNRKPHPEGVFIILERLNCQPENAMMVGDMDLDIEMGKNAGVLTCGVTYGIGSVESLVQAGADFILTDIRRLLYLV